MSKFKLTQTAAEVQDILNNSLQKPTGLTKTELVGVGVNGQENIEIGDNLTLANGKLSSAAAGALPSTIQFDEAGNRTAGKDVKVDGKLKLQSLVSASNPDGDITKELDKGGGGGSARHCYYVDVARQFIYIVNTEKNYNFTIGKENLVSNFTSNNYAELRTEGVHIAIGTYKESGEEQRIVRTFTLYSNKHSGYVTGTSLNPNTTTTSISIDLSSISQPFVIVQLY